MTDEVKKLRAETIECMAFMYVEMAEMLLKLKKATGESEEVIREEVLKMAEHEAIKKFVGGKNEAIRN